MHSKRGILFFSNINNSISLSQILQPIKTVLFDKQQLRGLKCLQIKMSILNVATLSIAKLSFIIEYHVAFNISSNTLAHANDTPTCIFVETQHEAFAYEPV